MVRSGIHPENVRETGQKGERAVDQIRRENVFNIPNLLTIVRMAMLPAVIWRFRMGDSMGALAVYLAAMLTDAVDGIIARRMNQITALGKLLDPVADKLSLVLLLGLFAADGQIPMWLLVIVLLKEAMLIAGSIAALRYGIVVYALPIGKVTTVTFIISMAMRFLRWQHLADILLSVSVALSLVSLLWYSVDLMKKLKAPEGNALRRMD